MATETKYYLLKREAWIEFSLLGMLTAYATSFCFNYFSGNTSHGEVEIGMLRAALMIFPFQIFTVMTIIASATFIDRDKHFMDKLLLKNWTISYFPQIITYELVLLPLMGAIAFGGVIILKSLQIPYSPPAIIEILSKSSNSVFLIIATGAVVTAPLAEEFLFRRVLYGFISQLAGKVGSTILVSAAFAGIHLSLVAFLPLFIMGLALQITVLKTGSLYPCILLHSFHNLVTMLIIFCIIR